ncbi:hypothetical protein CRG98_027836 [Punica granatum]|uniref:Uncharacterized protein n=1 Tax=Punica granatum TaxID=22663 RepID=A0A2I0J6B5_PUNGR|nr:hypothetical protein CRG98_027836 [Punica granatum]
MEKEQLQIKHFIGEKSEEFKNVFLEQMPPEQSPIKSVAIDSRMNPFEERRNDMIHLEDPLQGHEEESQDNRVGHEGELLDKHVPARANPDCTDRPGWTVSRPDWAVFGSNVTTESPDGILRQVNGVYPYNPTKITENRACPGNRPDWAVFGSNVATESPDRILMQGQWLPTPN